MFRIISFVFYFTVIALKISDAFQEEVEIPTTLMPEILSSDEESVSHNNGIEKAIEIIEKTAAITKKWYGEAVLPIEDTENLYDEMVKTLDDIIAMMLNPNDLHTFLKGNGIDRIINSNLNVAHAKLRTKLLLLLKILFDTAPTTTKTVIPVNVLDKLLDIFENEDNLALKAHALDILYVWLPGNPKIQARVMKLKGLEPFYEQISKLDNNVIYTLLDLFNKVVKEHLEIRSNTLQRSKIDSDDLILYQRIGLIEHLSTKSVCNGLLNIFQATWSYSTKDNAIIVPVLELIKQVKPFCLKKFQGKEKGAKLFDALLKYIREDDTKEYLQNFKLNVSDIEVTLAEYVNSLTQVKDEL